MQDLDQEIFHSIKIGDQKALEMLFHEFYQPLCQYAYSFLQDREDAEEVVQNSFVKIWEKREEIDIQTSAKAYLYRMIRNSCLNEIQHQKVKSQHQELAKMDGPGMEQSSDSIAIHGELEEKIRQAMEKLPEQCRLIFKLSRFEDLKYKEIAVQLNISVKTVENQMGKALKIMRHELKEYLPLILLLLENFLDP
ncbi:RNA polymerase sigma-70 factor [Algoriphagus sediminis]|uniref:RNA polymerase sigma-70 factor n=1 Tax=Algoriphagus sediminis TaxID=3057113 RepID=A0ABT7YFF6_9BACT|nr:RNA polymerase sigma-70 factor [Algoriphagus sediminis]MDN3205263.1 RNA polymerase sigma-70 factor [Algoriphagus sediminis]